MLQIFQKKNKRVQWVACEEVQAYLEEDIEFFGALEHNVEKDLPVKMKKKLKTHFTSLEKEYKRPTSFQLTLLQPYLSYLQLPVDNNDNSCSFGFADTQMAISTAFLFDTIPYMKTVERMTNPCFLNTEFAKLMKGKHGDFIFMVDFGHLRQMVTKKTAYIIYFMNVRRTQTRF